MTGINYSPVYGTSNVSKFYPEPEAFSSYDPVSKQVKVHSRLKNSYDSDIHFVINEDGSGTKQSAWTRPTEYEKGTFSDAYDVARKMAESKMIRLDDDTSLKIANMCKVASLRIGK